MIYQIHPPFINPGGGPLTGSNLYYVGGYTINYSDIQVLILVFLLRFTTVRFSVSVTSGNYFKVVEIFMKGLCCRTYTKNIWAQGKTNPLPLVKPCFHIEVGRSKDTLKSRISITLHLKNVYLPPHKLKFNIAIFSGPELNGGKRTCGSAGWLVERVASSFTPGYQKSSPAAYSRKPPPRSCRTAAHTPSPANKNKRLPVFEFVFRRTQFYMSTECLYVYTPCISLIFLYRNASRFVQDKQLVERGRRDVCGLRHNDKFLVKLHSLPLQLNFQCGNCNI